MHSHPNAPPIEIAGLSKTYRLGFLMNRRVRALEGLDLALRPGQVYGLLGPNGAGKSTTIKILMNLVQPTEGSARIFGASPSDRNVRRAIGFLPENPAPYEYLTGKEFVLLAGRLAGLSGADLDRRVREVLGAVGMEAASGLQIRRYSKGMVQRIGLAQAVVHRPKLLVLDEPTSGMDPLGRRQIRELIQAERDAGTTILFCTHIISDVESLCDRVAILVGGKRMREGTLPELLGGEAPRLELTLENSTLEKVKAVLPNATIEAQDHRWVVRDHEAAVQAALPALLAQGSRLVRLGEYRRSLEDLFLEVVSQGPSKVGGMIS